ncbi:MAG: hypothetical protein LAP40_17130 [Acidobacteriia bacterium]|nr:hypothetical protein [Terriglobia bacterium]
MAKYAAPAILALVVIASGCSSNRRQDVSDAAVSPAVHGPEPTPVLAERRTAAVANPIPPAPPEAPKAPVVKKKASVASPTLQAQAFDDPRRIQAGTTYREMVRRFGPPSMRVVVGPDRISYSYASRKSRVQVEVQGGKVISVEEADTGL